MCAHDMQTLQSSHLRLPGSTLLFNTGRSCRDLVHKDSPHFTLSKIQLTPEQEGCSAPVPAFSQLPSEPAVFQALAAAAPLCRQLRSRLSTTAACRRVAVIGAGAGAVPSVLAHQSSDTTVEAVDISAGALRIMARNHLPAHVHAWQRHGALPCCKMQCYLAEELARIL